MINYVARFGLLIVGCWFLRIGNISSAIICATVVLATSPGRNGR